MNIYTISGTVATCSFPNTKIRQSPGYAGQWLVKDFLVTHITKLPFFVCLKPHNAIN